MHSLESAFQKSIKSDSKKTRMGMLYAFFAGPALGLAFGLLGVLAGKAPFNLEYPTGAFAIIVLLQVPFGLLGVTVFALISGAYRDIWRVFRSRVSGWNLFVATGGFVGDLCYACSVVLVGGAIAGPIGGLFGVVGGLIVAMLYKEKINRWSTWVGMLAMGVGIWIVVSGGSPTSPTHGIYEFVGILIIVLATLVWGFENFAIAAGTDLMPAESFLFWRVGAAYIIGFILMWLLFPTSHEIARQVYSDPKLIAYGAVIGFGWSIWIIMGYYIAIAYAGGVRGGVMAGTFGFFFISFFSMTVYGVPFSSIVIFGSIIMFIGATLIITEPKELLASRR